MRGVAIVNPTSGGGRSIKLVDRIERFIEQQQLDVDVWTWEEAERIYEMIERAKSLEYNTIIAVGGDGTINAIAKQLAHTNIALGIVPSGTGNAIANHLGIPRKVEKALSVIAENHTLAIDTGMVNDRPFIGFAGFGLDARVAQAYQPIRKRSFMKYVWLSLKCYRHYQPQKLTITDGSGKQWEWDAHVVTIANVSQFGHHSYFAPGASVVDQQLDLVGLWIPNFWHIPAITWRIFSGTLPRSSYFKRIKGDQFIVSKAGPLLIQIDGEMEELEDSALQVIIEPHSLKVIVPKNSVI
jgi:diacylglycerol kinase (ATP)